MIAKSGNRFLSTFSVPGILYDFCFNFESNQLYLGIKISKEYSFNSDVAIQIHQCIHQCRKLT